MELNSIKAVVPGAVVVPDQMAVQPQQPIVVAPKAPLPDPVEKDLAKLREKLQEGTDKMNQTAHIFDRAVRFKLHEGTKEMMISVVDPNTDKVIREIPPKEFLDFIAKMKEYIGMVFDKKA